MDINAIGSTFNPARGTAPLQRGYISTTEGSPSSATGETLNSFGDLLGKEMNKVTALDNEARQNVESYASGGDIPLHQVILSVEKADMAMKMATQVRNKLVTAYQEISRMQV